MISDPWVPLAQAYAANRIGYSNELYDTIAAYGLRGGSTVLDVGCGTGIAAEPFARRGFTVTGADPSESMIAQAKKLLPNVEFVRASAESLPFPNERFDVLISAQAFHWVDRAAALREAHRVLRRGGIIAICWKHLMGSDPVKELRDRAFQALGHEAAPSGLSGGFKEFYASPDFADQMLRVIPWRTSMRLDRYMGYERSRRNVRDALGSRTGEYFALLETGLRELFSGGNPTIALAYVQYLYLAKNR